MKVVTAKQFVLVGSAVMKAAQTMGLGTASEWTEAPALIAPTLVQMQFLISSCANQAEWEPQVPQMER